MSTSSLTRRNFLKGAASLAAAAAIPAAFASTEVKPPAHTPWKETDFYGIVNDLMSAAYELVEQSKGAFSPFRDSFTFHLGEKSLECLDQISMIPPNPTVKEYIKAQFPLARFEKCNSLFTSGLAFAGKNGRTFDCTFDV